MSALFNRSNPILDGFKKEIAKLIWQCYDDIKDATFPIRISVLKIPITISLKVANLEPLIAMLVGPRLELGSQTFS
jgi:hypothetical protein